MIRCIPFFSLLMVKSCDILSLFNDNIDEITLYPHGTAVGGKLNMKKKVNVQQMAQLALLTAIVLLLAFTPLGYLKTPWGVEITFIVIPVAVGSIILGPTAGAFLGFVFGMTSFIQCFGASTLGVMMLEISPVGTFICCVAARVLVGLLPGLIYRLLKKIKQTRVLGIGICCFLTPIINTALYIIGNYLIFSGTWLDIAVNTYGYTGGGGLSLLAFMLGMVALNGVVEAISCMIVGTAVCKALQVIVHRA